MTGEKPDKFEDVDDILERHELSETMNAHRLTLCLCRTSNTFLATDKPIPIITIVRLAYSSNNTCHFLF
jgi:hypothetical protein